MNGAAAHRRSGMIPEAKIMSCGCFTFVLVVTHAHVFSCPRYPDLFYPCFIAALGPDVVVTGGYDGYARLWDWRVGGGGGDDGAAMRPVLEMRHPAHVEAVVGREGWGAIAAACGGSVVVWDIVAGGREMGACSRGVGRRKYRHPSLSFRNSPTHQH
jgi:hypothetical protein